MVCRSLTGLWVIVRSQLPIGAPRMARPAVPAGPLVPATGCAASAPSRLTLKPAPARCAGQLIA